MQAPHIKLSEVIYEITDNCGQDCSYCGSKESRNQTPIEPENIRAIIDEIAMCPPEQIDISGGNPLLVDLRDHDYLVKTLHEKQVLCKILFNPFNRKNDKETDAKIELYDWVGLSVNTKEEFEEFKSWGVYNKMTVITNFNVGNVFLFKEIEEFVIEQKLKWQIQYTMYKEKDALEIYSNTPAREYLAKLIEHSEADIVVADNMNPFAGCSAGIASIGILANGDVVPCLSMRSWVDEMKDVTFGNLLRATPQDTLTHIWVKKFAQFRCEEFKCCKDHCGIYDVDPPKITTNAPNGWTWGDPLSGLPDTPYIPKDGGVMAYAVFPNDMTILYGVQVQNRPFMQPNFTGGGSLVYGVQTKSSTSAPELLNEVGDKTTKAPDIKDEVNIFKNNDK